MFTQGKLPLMRMVELFTSKAKGVQAVLGRERRIAEGNQPGDLTLFSTDHAWDVPRVGDSASKSRNTPFDGRHFKGAPMVTILAGRVVYRRT